jgi:uncharacterized protein YjhX (UPF0386 family)
MDNKNRYTKCYNRDGWIISDNEEKRYSDIRKSLKEMDVLKPARSKKSINCEE